MSEEDANTANIKTISITGGAAEDFQKLRRTRKRKSRKSENVPVNGSAITFVRTEKAALQGGHQPPPVQSQPHVQPQPPVQAQLKNNIPPEPPAVQQQQGGTTKLILTPPKRRETRLLMKAPKGGDAASKQQQPTRKNVRKITLGLRGLTAKINRAKKLHKRVEDMKKEDIKKLLEEKKILKPGKKEPPEALMRQMYSDYLILTSKGL